MHTSAAFSSNCSLSLVLLTRLEKGDFKLRVRTTEVERQLQRSKLVEKNIFAAALSGLFLNIGVSLATVGREVVASTPLSRAMFIAAFAMGTRIPYGIMQINKLDAYNERFGVSNKK